MRSIIQQIKSEIDRDLEIRDRVIRSYINNLLSDCIQKIDHSNKEIAFLQKQIYKIEKDNKISAIREILNKHYEQSRRH